MAAGAQEFVKRHGGVLVILLIALAVRLVYLWTYYHLPDWTQLTVDNYYHLNWAMNMVDGNVLGDATYFRAPFYIYCLAVLFKLFGSGLWVARLFGLAIGMVSISLTYAIGARVFDRRVGLLAALLQAIVPIVIYFEFELLLDPLFMLLVQASIYSLLVWWDTGRTGHIFISGLFLGLSAITRPTSLALLPVLLIVIFGLRRDTRRLISQLLAVGVAMALTIGPVFVRNLIVADDPVLIASQGGINLYIANNPAANGLSAVLPEPLGSNWRISQISYIAEQSEGRKLKPGEVSSYWTGRAVDWMLGNPVSFLKLYLKKLYFNIENLEASNNRNLGMFFASVALFKYNPISFGLIFALAVGSLACGALRNKRAMLLVVLVLTYVFVSAFFFFASRFRLPLMPLYVILGSSCAVTISDLLFAGRLHRLLPIVAIALAAGLLSYVELAKTPYTAPAQYFSFQGLTALNSGDVNAALKNFRLGREVDSTFPEMNLNLGVAFLRTGQTDSAMYYFKREQDLNPGRLKAATNVASVYLLQKKYSEAMREVQPVIASQPFDVTANMVLLRAMLLDTSLTNAGLMDSIKAASIRTDTNIYLLDEAAGLLLQRSMRDDARRKYLEAAASAPPPIETDDEAFEAKFKNSIPNWTRQKALAYYQLGFMSGVDGDYSSAILNSERAIALDSNLVEAYVNLISGYYSQGELVRARDLLAQALLRFPGNSYLLRLKQTLP